MPWRSAASPVPASRRSPSRRCALDRQNSDTFAVESTTDYERLLTPFVVSKGVVIAPGGYSFSDVSVAYGMGLQHRVSGTWTVQRGQFHDGTITAFSYTGAWLSLLEQWSMEPSVSLNDVRLPAGHFRTTLLRTRSDYGSRRARSRPPSCSSAPPTRCSAATCDSAGSTFRAVSCSPSIPMNATH
jgi:hypothetical protein